MAFNLIDLPFAKDALGTTMSAETLDYHHGKHHQAYVDKVNAVLEEKGLTDASLAEVIRAGADRGDVKLFNNAAQIWNHNFFWRCLASPDNRRPTGKLAALVEECFGSTDQLLAKLKEEAVNHFSNGWAWLALDRDKLVITSLHDADTPVVHEGMKPLLTLDVWEHAYYIDYRNDRGRFAEQVLANIIDWDFVASNLDGEGISRADQQADAKTLELTD
jgi:Fe-Mn family superoxide dismutase